MRNPLRTHTVRFLPALTPLLVQLQRALRLLPHTTHLHLTIRVTGSVRQAHPKAY
jgi:hypothetical protein